MDDKQLEIIKKTVADLVKKIGFQAKVEIKKENKEENENVVCSVLVENDPHILIGQHGINLLALQHLARVIVRKKTNDKLKFMLDINNYCEEKNNSITETAKQAAEQAVIEGRAIIMRPMSAYERRLVHMALAEDMNVITESIGEGESRKVVIKPAKMV